MDIHVEVSVRYVFIYLRGIPRSGISREYDKSMLNFWGTTRLFSIILHFTWKIMNYVKMSRVCKSIETGNKLMVIWGGKVEAKWEVTVNVYGVSF